MTRQKLLIIASIITCYLLQAQGADKYSDENRPYEFGFTIDGQQHRHEEKDSKGIIKGEYGFITADGVYHVTVYATDEQGRFKILSMKNIRYKDYKGRTPTAARQGHSLTLPPSQPKVTNTNQKPNYILASEPKPALELETISIEPPANSCSHCSLPTTSTEAPEVNIPPINQLDGASNSPNAPGQSNIFNAGNTPYSPPSNSQQNGFNVNSQEQYAGRQENSFRDNQNYYSGNQGFGQVPQTPGQQNSYNTAQSIPQQPSESGKPLGSNGVPSIGQAPNVPAQQFPPGGQQFAPLGQQLTPNGPQYAPGGQQFAPGVQQFTPVRQEFIPAGQQITPTGPEVASGGQQAAIGGQQISPIGQQFAGGNQQYQGAGPQIENMERTRSGKQYTASPNLSTSQNSGIGGSGLTQASVKPNQKPMLAYAQMQIVDKKTDIHAKRPGEKDGLPAGLKEDDVLKLLYTFNYTLGFQAHFEEGYTNGEKRGYYYTTGRNGVRTRIDYVADENGFRPTLSQEVFDLLSDDVPKENTEKEEKYGLKGYEFKWLYFPPDTSSQQNTS